MKSLILLLGVSLYSALVFGQDCNSVSVTGGNQQITVSGLSGAPIATVQVFNSSWASVFNQTYTNPAGSVVVPSLSAGQYFVNVRFYTSGWAQICEKGFNATVTNTPAPPADVCGSTFQKSVGRITGNDEAFGFAKAIGGGYYAVGHSAATGTTNYDGLIMKFDGNGNLLWSKTVGGAQEDYLTQVVPTADGGCLAAGSANSTGILTFSGETWLIRFDASGNIVWQKKYFISGNAGNLSGLVATSDGGFAFTGTFPFSPGVSEWMIVKTDGTGNILWQRKLGTASSDSGNGIIEDEHGGAGLVVCGIFYSNSWYDAVISKLNLTTGGLMWTKAYDMDSRSNWPGPIYKVADGFIFDILNADGFEQQNATTGLLKTDFNGNFVWAKEFVTATPREAQLAVLPDGGFLVEQGEWPHGLSSDMYLIRLDAAANIMWSKRYPKPGAQWLWGLEAEGNYVVGAGISTVGAYNDVMFARTDLNGKFGTCTSENFNVTIRNMNVTPLINFSWPTNTALTLSTTNTNFTAATITPVENILCSDGCPTVTIGNVTVNENAGNAVVQVCISAPAANTIAYNYTTANGSATSGSDYTGGNGTVTIAAGQTCGTINIPITNDTDVESAENFTVSIGNVTGTVTINDDDQAINTCSDVTVTAGSNKITVTGVTAPVATVQVFNNNWATVFNQTYTNAPGTVNVNIGPGDYLVKVTFYTANWAYVCDKSVNVTVVNNCPAGTICVSNNCPSQTVNLNTAYSIPNLPAGATVTWHTGTPATDANKMTDAEAQNVSVSGTYYAAINIAGGGCYSGTIAVNVTIVPCSVPAEKMSVRVTSDEQSSMATRNIVAFPNPFTRSVRVVIDSEKSEKATVVLMDVQGRPVKQMPVQLSRGNNTILMEGLDQLSSGNYFLKVSSTSGTKTLKLMRQQ